MAEEVDWNDEHIGKRVIYTARGGKQREGVLTEILEISVQSGKMLNLKLDGDSRERFYVPEDMVTLVSGS